MSLASTTIQAVRIAKIALGDLVTTTTLRSLVSRDYVDGEYRITSVDKTVEVAVDKFTFHEQQLEKYQQTDVKLIVFNLNNDITISMQDQIIWNARELNVIEATPVYAGSTIPVWTVVLRK